MTADWIKDIPNWEKEYLNMEGVQLSVREKELLKGDAIKSHEGMVYGRCMLIVTGKQIINISHRRV